MESQNQMQEKQFVPYLTNSQTIENIDRRSANYKPNVWKYDFLQSLSSNYNENQYERQVENLTMEVKQMLSGAEEILVKLELVDRIRKLGIESHFKKEIKQALDVIAISITTNSTNLQNNLYATALCFRILRQHSYQVSQDMFIGFLDEKGTFVESNTCMDIKGLIELSEASHLAMEGENILKEAKFFSSRILKRCSHTYKDVYHTLEISSHRRALWFDVKWQINDYEKYHNKNDSLLRLAKLNFNVVQATLQKDLKEISRWWTNLGLIEKMSFTRDRLVESFMCTVGLVFAPHYSKFRKWLTKVIIMILVTDDVYDVYGSLHELQQFTDAIKRWDSKEVHVLPECMNICFEALNDITNEIAHGVQTEKGWSQSYVQPHMKKGWADFCESLFVEAKWFSSGYTPSYQEYMANAWISSSGPLLSVISFFCLSNHEETGSDMDNNFLGEYQDLIYNVSMIIRLCNDLGTSVAEQERGDAASSIACLVRESSSSEDAARNYINEMINSKWININERCNKMSSKSGLFVNVVTNMSRVAHNLYHNGDKFAVQDRENKKQILSLLVQPLQLE